jgi:DNA-binding XRE family transcriptional regulator
LRHSPGPVPLPMPAQARRRPQSAARGGVACSVPSAGRRPGRRRFNGDRLGYLRERAFMTQEQLAERAEVSASTIVRLETGRISRPRNGTILLIAQALDVHPDEFLRKFGGIKSQPLATNPRRFCGDVGSRAADCHCVVTIRSRHRSLEAGACNGVLRRTPIPRTPVNKGKKKGR